MVADIPRIYSPMPYRHICMLKCIPHAPPIAASLMWSAYEYCEV